MNKYILFFVLMLTGVGAWAQQDAQYSMYMFNGLVLNPAYAGSRENLSMTLIGRKQWLGFDGSPVGGSFSVHGPTRNLRHGLGGFVSYDKVGPISNINATFAYAFRIPLNQKNAVLALGIQGSFANYRANFSGVNLGDPTWTTAGGVAAIDPNDPAFNGNSNVSLFQPNAGAGIRFSNKWMYAGASIPHFINNRLFAPEQQIGDDKLLSRRYYHYLFQAGFIIPFGKQIKFRPSTFIKYVPAAGVQLDVNASFLFVEKFWVGASYRLQEGFIFMAEWNISKSLRVGYAYDLTTSGMKSYTTGSHEIMLGFDFNFNKKSMISPRYF